MADRSSKVPFPPAPPPRPQPPRAARRTPVRRCWALLASCHPWSRPTPRRSGAEAGWPPSLRRAACAVERLAVARESKQGRCQPLAGRGTRRSCAGSRGVTPLPASSGETRVTTRGCRLIGRCRHVGRSAAETGPIVSPGAAAWDVQVFEFAHVAGPVVFRAWGGESIKTLGVRPPGAPPPAVDLDTSVGTPSQVRGSGF